MVSESEPKGLKGKERQEETSPEKSWAVPTNQAWDPHQQERQKILKAQREQMPTTERGTATQGYGLLAQPWPECTSELGEQS